MDAQLRTKWLEALRSGDYEQCQGLLRLEDKTETTPRHGFCCLGVLCSVMGAEWIDGRPWLGRVPLDDDDEELLGDKAIQLAGLDEPLQNKLSEMNDNGSDFRVIADYIEANIPAESPQ